MWHIIIQINRTLIGGSIRVEDPAINKASLRLTTPETIHCNIQTSILLSVRSSKRELIWVTNRLQLWFNNDLSTHFS